MAGEEKTALEIILELPSILRKLENKIDVLDTNLKILNSKMNKARQNDVITSDIVDTPSPVLPTATPGLVGTSSVISRQKSQKLTIGNIKVFSNVKTASGKSVDGMTVNIFDASNDLVRNIVTDNNGYWDCRLPVGKYSIEMIHPKLKTINKQFELFPATKTFEIV